MTEQYPVQVFNICVPLQEESHAVFHHKTEQLTLEDLYKQCFDEYFDRLYGYAFTIVKNNDEAKDIVQAAYIKLWEKRDEVDMNFARPYLYTTVYRLALNSIRNARTKESRHYDLTQKESTVTFNAAEQKETGNRIQNEIDMLPPRCKEVFYKSRFEGKKYAQISEEMNISIKTVEAQMGKALKILRDRLSDLITFWIIYFFM